MCAAPPAHFHPSNPDALSIEPPAREVKMLRFYRAHKYLDWLTCGQKKGSGRWGCRPLRAWGDGGAETRGGHPASRRSWGVSFAGRRTVPESTVILRPTLAPVDRPEVGFAPVRRYRRFAFAQFSLLSPGSHDERLTSSWAVAVGSCGIGP